MISLSLAACKDDGESKVSVSLRLTSTRAHCLTNLLPQVEAPNIISCTPRPVNRSYDMTIRQRGWAGTTNRSNTFWALVCHVMSDRPTRPPDMRHRSGCPAGRQWASAGARFDSYFRTCVWTDHRSDHTSRQSTVPVE